MERRSFLAATLGALASALFGWWRKDKEELTVDKPPAGRVHGWQAWGGAFETSAGVIAPVDCVNPCVLFSHGMFEYTQIVTENDDGTLEGGKTKGTAQFTQLVGPFPWVNQLIEQLSDVTHPVDLRMECDTCTVVMKNAVATYVSSGAQAVTVRMIDSVQLMFTDLELKPKGGKDALEHHVSHAEARGSADR